MLTTTGPGQAARPSQGRRGCGRLTASGLQDAKVSHRRESTGYQVFSGWRCACWLPSGSLPIPPGLAAAAQAGGSWWCGVAETKGGQRGVLVGAAGGAVAVAFADGDAAGVAVAIAFGLVDGPGWVARHT